MGMRQTPRMRQEECVPHQWKEGLLTCRIWPSTCYSTNPPVQYLWDWHQIPRMRCKDVAVVQRFACWFASSGCSESRPLLDFLLSARCHGRFCKTILRPTRTSWSLTRTRDVWVLVQNPGRASTSWRLTRTRYERVLVLFRRGLHELWRPSSQLFKKVRVGNAQVGDHWTRHVGFSDASAADGLLNKISHLVDFIQEIQEFCGFWPGPWQYNKTKQHTHTHTVHLQSPQNLA